VAVLRRQQPALLGGAQAPTLQLLIPLALSRQHGHGLPHLSLCLVQLLNERGVSAAQLLLLLARGLELHGHAGRGLGSKRFLPNTNQPPRLS
jgi:hypothetical protein